MELVIERGIKNGKEFCYVKAGDRFPPLYEISRELTGTSSEKHQGVFSPDTEETFWYGDQKKEFEFADELDLKTDTPEAIQLKLERRVALVTTWAMTRDHSETFVLSL